MRKRLKIEDQEELILTLEESEDPKNLISHDEMKKKHQKWLQRSSGKDIAKLIIKGFGVA